MTGLLSAHWGHSGAAAFDPAVATPSFTWGSTSRRFTVVVNQWRLEVNGGFIYADVFLDERMNHPKGSNWTGWFSVRTCESINGSVCLRYNAWWLQSSSCHHGKLLIITAVSCKWRLTRTPSKHGGWYILKWIWQCTWITHHIHHFVSTHYSSSSTT